MQKHMRKPALYETAGLAYLVPWRRALRSLGHRARLALGLWPGRWGLRRKGK